MSNFSSIRFDQPLYRSEGTILASSAYVVADLVQVGITETHDGFDRFACATLTLDQVDELIQQLQKAKEVAR